jgi:hypothetical protein
MAQFDHRDGNRIAIREMYVRQHTSPSMKRKLPEPERESQHKILSDVASQHCHVIKVLRGESNPPFAYSIGLYENFAHPEILVVGLDLDLMHRLINGMKDLISAGTRFSPGSRCSEILNNLDCEFRPVAPLHYANLFGQASWFYGGDDFPVLQCVWPDRQGRFPGERDFDLTFSDLQPTYESAARPSDS